MAFYAFYFNLALGLFILGSKVVKYKKNFINKSVLNTSNVISVAINVSVSTLEMFLNVSVLTIQRLGLVSVSCQSAVSLKIIV